MGRKIIVFGNEKGGSGKSTAAVQVAVGLLRQGHSIATLDLDARQGTLSRYMKHREEHGGLPMPRHAAVLPSPLDSQKDAAEADRWAL
jgi:chromosome partitioning protein